MKKWHRAIVTYVVIQIIMLVNLIVMSGACWHGYGQPAINEEIF